MAAINVKLGLVTVAAAVALTLVVATHHQPPSFVPPVATKPVTAPAAPVAAVVKPEPKPALAAPQPQYEPFPDWPAMEARAKAGDLLARLQVYQEGPELRAAVEEARGSSDPLVQYALAWVLLRPDFTGNDPADGLSYMIKACRKLGCDLADPRYGHGCVQTGACSTGMTLIDKMEQVFGPAVIQDAAAR